MVMGKVKTGEKEVEGTAIEEAVMSVVEVLLEARLLRDTWAGGFSSSGSESV